MTLAEDSAVAELLADPAWRVERVFEIGWTATRHPTATRIEVLAARSLPELAFRYQAEKAGTPDRRRWHTGPGSAVTIRYHLARWALLSR